MGDPAEPPNKNTGIRYKFFKNSMLRGTKSSS